MRDRCTKDPGSESSCITIRQAQVRGSQLRRSLRDRVARGAWPTSARCCLCGAPTSRCVVAARLRRRRVIHKSPASDGQQGLGRGGAASDDESAEDTKKG
eukprot:scaffold112076_cov30-Tisochrysis_lutea.AAC.1